MKRVLFGLVASAMLVAAECQVKAAPVEFSVMGEFIGGGDLEGTITIDTATGDVKSADLVVAESGNVVSFGEFGGTVKVVSGHVVITLDSDTGSEYFGPDAVIQLVIPADTLVGYKGGRLVPYTQGATVFSKWTGGDLGEGSVTEEE